LNWKEFLEPSLNPGGEDIILLYEQPLIRGKRTDRYPPVTKKRKGRQGIDKKKGRKRENKRVAGYFMDQSLTP